MATIIYCNTKKEFTDDLSRNLVISKMEENARMLGLSSSESETKSWEANAKAISNVLKKVGNEVMVTFEFMLPYSSKRVDCILYGKGNDKKDRAVHIELKQWTNNGVSPSTSEANFEVEAYTGGSVKTVCHPSQQARGYQKYMMSFMTAFELGTELRGCGYCYNYERKGDPSVLYDPKFEELQEECRTYAKEDVDELANKLAELIGGGDGLRIFNAVTRSPFRASKKLLDSVSGMLTGTHSKEFVLLEDQQVAANTIYDKIRSEKNEKHVIIVKGGPGTGKTVIALHTIAKLAKLRRKTTGTGYTMKYLVHSASIRKALRKKIGNDQVNTIIGYDEFTLGDSNAFDILMLDEAHRSGGTNKQSRTGGRTSSMTIFESIIYSARTSVFFIDELQKARQADNGSEVDIKKAAKHYGAIVEEVELKTQFRCNGSDNYLEWLEQVLYGKVIKSTFSKREYDLQMFDDPQKLYKAIVAQNEVNGQTARMVAGFCWPWTDSPTPVNDVQIGDFQMPWETHRNVNRRPAGYCLYDEWAYDSLGIKQIGCIYTAQGFEFDYIGVILGPDIKYRDGKIVTDVTKTCDPALSGRGRANFDTYCRNIYRVLMTRGMKGCYIYVCDEGLREYLSNEINKMGLE